MAVRTAAPATKKPSTAIVPWDEKLSKYAKQARAATGAPSGNFIGTAGGILKVDKVPVPGNQMEVIVLAHIFENALYDSDFDPDNPQPPVCFAFGQVTDDMTDEEAAEVEAGMVPHKASEKPQVGVGSPNPDCVGCADCPNNAWASSDRGRGKACKNGRRLGIIAGDAVETGVLAAKVRYLKIPPTSLGGWDGYVSQCADTLNRPPFALVTAFRGIPSPEGRGFKIGVDLKAKIEDMVDDPKVFDELEQKHILVAKEIAFPYQAMAEEDREASKRPKDAGARAKFIRPAAANPAPKAPSKFRGR
jgi:hypothetical protein